MSDIVGEIRGLASPKKEEKNSLEKSNGVSVKPDDTCSRKMKLIKNWFKDTSRTRRGRKANYDDLFDLCGIREVGGPLGKRTRRTRNGIAHHDAGESAVKKLPERVVELSPTQAQKLKEIENSSRPITRRMRGIHKPIKKVIDRSDSGESDSDSGSGSDGAIFDSDDEELGYKPTRGLSPKKKKAKRAGTLKKEQPEPITNTDSSESEGETNFVFINEATTKQSGYKKRVYKKRTDVAKRDFVLNSDPFQTPRKQRVGLLLLSKTPSPSKKGIYSKLGTSPMKSPASGRSGTPKKNVTLESHEQSAKRKRSKTLASRLFDNDEDDLDHDYTEKLELERRSPTRSVKQSPFETPRKQIVDFDLPTHDPNFIPTPLPTTKEDETFFEGKFKDKALFLDGTEGYFEQHLGVVKTSNSSMAQAPHLTYDEFNSFNFISSFLHNQQKEELMRSHRSLYHQCLFELKFGFNLVFYGVGSKRTYLLDFVESYLLDHIDVPTIVVNGYNPAIRFPQVLNQIVKVLGIDRNVPKRTSEQVDFLVDHFKSKPDTSRLIILIHNIDCEQFRDEKIQDYLSKLAAIQQFHLITSIDHINAPLLWDSMRLSNFNFVWHNVTTYQDYKTEVSFNDPLSLGQTQKIGGSFGAKAVFLSLPMTSKMLFRILATNQLKNLQEQVASKQMTKGEKEVRGGKQNGLKFPVFYRLCLDEFVASNEVNFRTMLMEFVEHKMAVLTRDSSGEEVVYIPCTYEELLQLIEEELS
jgi:origin recognition complex subunit 2